MADLGTSTAPSGASATSAEDVAGTGRRVRRRRSLPGGRAVAGAFLITAAAVGVFAAYLNATAVPATEWVVATRDLPRGTVLEPEMLDTVAIDVPATQQDAMVRAGDRDTVVGRVTLGPVRGGDLLQWTTVLAVEPPTGASTFTFALPSSRVAHRGDLAAGDTIDVVATYSDTTTYVARDVELLLNPAATEAGTSLTVAVDDPTTVLAIANALDAAQVHVLRSPPDGDGNLPPPFRPLQASTGGGGTE